jgi:hypothetical protein
VSAGVGGVGVGLVLEHEAKTAKEMQVRRNFV